MNNTDPLMRPVADSGSPARHPTASGANTGAATAAATGADPPTPIPRQAPASPASNSRNIPQASTPNASNACAGPVGLLSPNADKARTNARTGLTAADAEAGLAAAATGPAELAGASGTPATADAAFGAGLSAPTTPTGPRGLTAGGTNRGSTTAAESTAARTELTPDGIAATAAGIEPPPAPPPDPEPACCPT